MIAVELEPISPAALPLRSRQRNVAFGAEDVAIEVRNPLASARRHVEVAYFGLDMRRHAVPVALRIAIDDVGGRNRTQVATTANLLQTLVHPPVPPELVWITHLPP